MDFDHGLSFVQDTLGIFSLQSNGLAAASSLQRPVSPLGPLDSPLTMSFL